MKSSPNKNEMSPQRCRFVCSTPGCETPLHLFAAMPRPIAVAMMRGTGWAIFEGESVCPTCVQRDLETGLRASLSAKGAA